MRTKYTVTFTLDGEAKVRRDESSRSCSRNYYFFGPNQREELMFDNCHEVDVDVQTEEISTPEDDPVATVRLVDWSGRQYSGTGHYIKSERRDGQSGNWKRITGLGPVSLSDLDAVLQSSVVIASVDLSGRDG